MTEYLSGLLNKISLIELNVLLLLGLALFGGTVGGRLFQKLRIPKVVGYIIIGIVIGRSGLGLVDEEIIEVLRPFNYFALGLIGFMVGGELKKEVFSKYGKPVIAILLCEGLAPFLLVTLFVGIVGSHLLGASPAVWALALLLGAISSATDPATTTSVLKEYKTRGPVTTNVLGIVALDDGLALILFALASTVTGVLLGQGNGIVFKDVIRPLYEIVAAVGIGLLAGFGLSKIIRKYVEKERILAFTVGAVLLVTGLSLALDVSMLLAVMTLGIVVVNSMPHKSKETFDLVDGFTPPIYVLFFVLVGAKLKFSSMTPQIFILVLVYLIWCLGGKAFGAYIGARISGAPKAVAKNLPFALFSQAGIAIGLSILAAQHFPGEIGDTLVIIITATTFITQLVGPPLTRWAMTRAGEVGLNITEEDIIETTKVGDVMDKNPPLIYESMHLTEILNKFSEDDYLSYPVINRDKVLKGIITVEGLKQAFMDTDISGLILAHDLMDPIIAKVDSDVTVKEIKETLEKHGIEAVPVVDKKDKVEGFVERKKLNKFISTKVLELQKQSDSLEN